MAEPEEAAGTGGHGADATFSRVVEGGYCIGCGACAALPGAAPRVGMDDFGRIRASLPDGARVSVGFAGICPFSGESADEDTIALERFGAPGTAVDPEIGRHLACYVGHVAEGQYRSAGSSGGMTSWILAELVATGAVDRVLHVVPSADDRLFAYDVSTTVEAVRGGARSRYYPVTLANALLRLLEEEGRAAIVGVPCFVKAANLLRRNDERLATRIAFTVGIFCGHMKSARFAEYLAAQLGHSSGAIATVNFRHKYADRPASDYGFEVIGRDGRRRDRRMAEMDGGNWGYGLFKYSACNYCDDVTAETADVAFGDAWLPGEVDEPRGTNVAVVRHPAMARLIERGIADGRLALRPVDARIVAESQAAGLRDRREGLAHRLAAADAAGRWRPDKRVAARVAPDPRRGRVYDLRVAIAAASHEGFAAARRTGSLAPFDRTMRPLLAAYDALYRQSWLVRAARLPRRVAGKLRREIRRFLS